MSVHLDYGRSLVLHWNDRQMRRRGGLGDRVQQRQNVIFDR